MNGDIIHTGSIHALGHVSISRLWSYIQPYIKQQFKDYFKCSRRYDTKILFSIMCFCQVCTLVTEIDITEVDIQLKVTIHRFKYGNMPINGALLAHVCYTKFTCLDTGAGYHELWSRSQIPLNIDNIRNVHTRSLLSNSPAQSLPGSTLFLKISTAMPQHPLNYDTW